MKREKVLLIALVVVVGLLLSSSNVWAEPCEADTNCDEKVDLTDLVTLKGEFLSPDCGSCYPRLTCEGTLSPLGRWCDQGDGTVKDMTSGLVWLKDASCMFQMHWENAIEQPITSLRSGDCSGTLTDGSVWGDWRLPTKTELYNLANGSEAVRSSSMQFFTGVRSDSYWSSTTYADDTDLAWLVSMFNGDVYFFLKFDHFYVWPVRDPL